MSTNADRPRAKNLNPLRALLPFIRPYRGMLAAAVAASSARAALAAQLAMPTISVRKNNTCQEISRLQGFEMVACIVSPKINYMVR